MITFREHTVILYCPYTGNPISNDIPLTTSDGTGFIDEGFITDNMGFKYRNLQNIGMGTKYITHDELRKFLLDFDIQQLRILEGLIKFYSRIMVGPMLVTRHPDRINDEISKDVTTTSQEFHADISKNLTQQFHLFKISYEEFVQIIDIVWLLNG